MRVVCVVFVYSVLRLETRLIVNRRNDVPTSNIIMFHDFFFLIFSHNYYVFIYILRVIYWIRVSKKIISKWYIVSDEIYCNKFTIIYFCGRKRTFYFIKLWYKSDIYFNIYFFLFASVINNTRLYFDVITYKTKLSPP